jgi:hypothetical protein
MSLILGANQLTAGGYEVDNSLRFNSGSSDYLSRTPAGAGNQTTMTISFWAKRSTLSSATDVISQGTGSACHINFDGSNQIEMNLRNSVDGASNVFLITSQLFRDVSAWYHIVLALDTTQATNTNRAKLYVNGTQVTAFSTTTYPSQNGNLFFNEASAINIGRSVSTGSHYNGYLSEFYFIDGQQLTPTSFGETDADTNIWKPIPYTGSFGTNGFYLEFKDSSALGDDTSGNGNDFTVNNLTSVDQSTDTPTNNFATLINASSASKTYTLSEGNLKVTSSTSNWFGVPRGSIGVSSGKWYFEVKVTDAGDNFMVGYMSATNLADVGDRAVNGFPKINGFQSSGFIKRQDDTEVDISGSIQWDDGDIGQIALDMDNKKLWIGKNGSYYNSGNPATGSNETIGSSYFTANEAYLPALVFFGTNDGSFNFGNPPFTISSGNSDADGFGNFEYAVPSGYFALCTKNLAEYG